MGAPSNRQRPSLWIRITRVRFFWLLASLVGYILIAPSFPASEGGEWESVAMVLLIFSAAIYVSKKTRRKRVIGFMILLIVINAGLNLFFKASPLLDLILLLSLLATLIYTAMHVLTFVLDDGEVGAEHIYGAICAYVMIAMAYATAYLILELVQPASFSNVLALHHRDHPWWQFFYFSFSTLSTVGYGDIFPVTMRARSFVITEQMVAVFYVAILIARLTGMYSVKPDDPQDSEKS